MIWRVLIMAATVGAGLVAGRRAVNREIAKKLPEEVETAKARAVAELDKQADEIIGEKLLAFLTALLVKAGLIGAAYWLYADGHLTERGLQILGGSLICGFIVRDIVKTAPFALPALRLLKGHQWRPVEAVREFVAAMAFERAYAVALEATTTGPARRYIAFSRYSSHNISTEIAEAVADVARSVTVDLVRVRITIAALCALAMFGAYGAFFALTIGAVAAG